MDLTLKGARVIVTAGAGGIGRAIVEGFLAEGASVATCDIDESALATLPDAVFRARVDVSDSEALVGFMDPQIWDVHIWGRGAIPVHRV